MAGPSTLAPVRLGMVGVGFIGGMHAKAIERVPGVELVAVAGSRPERLQAFVESHPGVSGAQSVDELLDRDLDGVIVAVPTDLHESVTCTALRRGVKVMVEKPMALTLDACDRILRASEDSGTPVMTGLLLRHDPCYRALRDVVTSGRLGRLKGVFASRRASGGGGTGWGSDPRRSGGPLLDLMIHDLDFALALAGRPSEVRALGSCGPRGWNVVQAQLGWAEGAFGVVECVSVRAPRYPFTMECRLILEGGIAELQIRSQGGQIDQLAPPTLGLFTAEGSREDVVCEGDAFVNQIEAFAAMCRTGRPPREGTSEQGRESVALALQVRDVLEANDA